ncbi:MAG TPA: hypothetical protein EYO34_01775 [Candidatus Marinimicrobia bacterium]|nr:hypothetical protein [Candidatus Neomarinimicrobiota bacterium]HIB95289.1 hypothetical protein [Candidatus Neomarinimicrobiota bacterium]HIO74728.1 hypothetical protein [Candidatus Neomarinimicrobiota bacterium]
MLKKSILFLVVALSVWSCAVDTKSGSIPHPSEYFGREIGDPGVLIPHSKILEYYRFMEERSDRVKVVEIGETTEGRPFYYAIVTSPENHARLDNLINMNSNLYDPRGVSDGEIQQIVREGKTFMVANHQIHSTEVGASQGALLMAHRMATGDDHEVSRILDNVVLIHVPVHNPDGQERVYEWLDKWRGTEHENSRPPFLYQKYVGHDNNRDWYMFTQVETQLSIEIQNKFHPQFTLDQHQMGSRGARIFVPPFEDPWEPGIDPALIASNNMIGTYMGQYLTSRGLKGVEWKNRYDAWTPARAYYHYHGGVRILTEVAGANFADELDIPFDSLGSDYQRLRWNFPMPWEGGTWTFKEIVNYHYTSSMAALLAGADLREQLLAGMAASQKRSVEPGEDSPFAFIVPDNQTDPPTATKLLQVLEMADVEIEKAQTSFSVAGNKYGEGSHVIRFAQPAGRFAKTVLERQDYPKIFMYEGGPLDPPYDVTAHTLPLLMNVDVDFVYEPFSANLTKVDEIQFPKGSVTGGRNTVAWLLDPRVNHSYSAAVELAKHGLTRVMDRFTVGGTVWPAGTFVLQRRSSDEMTGEMAGLVKDVASRFHIDITGVDNLPNVSLKPVIAPKVAIYQSYSPSMPEGWFRWVLDEHKIPYDILHYDDINDARLTNYSILFLPPGGGSPKMMVEGQTNVENSTPPAYADGIGEEGVDALDKFVQGGGTLYTWSGAWRFLQQYMNVDVKAVNDGLDRTEFNIPGSLLRVNVDTSHPLGFGLTDETAIFFRRDSAWPANMGDANVIASYPADDLLLSGWIQGEDVLVNQAAMVEIPRGKGRMVMTGFYPEYRGQAHQTYKMMFNAIFYAGD